MTKYRVLVPTDGSEFCRQIYPAIAKFLAPEQCRLILLRAGEPPVGHTGIPPHLIGYPQAVQVGYLRPVDAVQVAHPIYASQEAESLTAEIRRQMAPDIHILELAGYEVDFAVRLGKCCEAIVGYIRENEIDLVAMATHWRHGVDKLVHGCVSDYVAHHVEVPILTIVPTHGR